MWLHRSTRLPDIGSAIMNDKRSALVQHYTGQVRLLCYLLDEPTTTLTIQAAGQTITAYASGQIAQDLRALPRRTTICVMFHDVSPDNLEIIAFSVVADDGMIDPNPRGGAGYYLNRPRLVRSVC